MTTTPCSTGLQSVYPKSEKPAALQLFQINITTANELIAEWTNIAKSIARQCKWRPQGQCLTTCKGLALCNLEGLTLVDVQGHPVQPEPPWAQATPPDVLNPEA